MSLSNKNLSDLIEGDAVEQSDALPDSSKMTDLESLVQRHRTLEAQVARAEEDLKLVKADLRRLNQEEIPDMFTQMGLSQIVLKDGTKVGIKPELSVSIKKGHEAECFQFLTDNNLATVIKTNLALVYGKDENEGADEARRILTEARIPFTDKQGVHAMTLKSVIRELTECGSTIPDQFNYFPCNKTTIK